MATIYVRSTDGDNADNGSTWALAKATLAGADAIDAAGDTIFVSQVHAESTAGAVTLTPAGTIANPTKIICGNDGAEPPTAVATSATVTTTGANGITIAGAGVYCYGISFRAGTGANSVGLTLANLASCRHVYENCDFQALGTGGGGFVRAGNNGAANMSCSWINCSVKFSSTTHVLSTPGRLHWNGGGVISGGTTPTVLFGSYLTSSCGVLCENVDFSNFSATFNITAPPPTYATFVMRDCKLPAAWSGTLLSSAFATVGRAEMYNCSAGSQNYKLWIEAYPGSIRDEATLVRTGGASDGTTTISWKMVTNASSSYPTQILDSPDIVIWNDTTGSAKTLTVHILYDSATNLKDDEVWLEATYLGSSSQPLGTLITDAKASYLATAADQSASTETWTTSGMTNPNTDKLHVTFTPQLKGFFICRLKLAKASTTVYVCPKAVVS